MWLNGLNFLIVSHHFAKFSCDRSCGSSDTAFKIVYVTLQDHMIQGSSDFMEGNSSLYITTLAKLIAIIILLFHFLPGFSFTNIDVSQDSRVRGGDISFTPLYHFQPLHLDINHIITAESSPLYIAA